MINTRIQFRLQNKTLQYNVYKYMHTNSIKTRMGRIYINFNSATFGNREKKRGLGGEHKRRLNCIIMCVF